MLFVFDSSWQTLARPDDSSKHMLFVFAVREMSNCGGDARHLGTLYGRGWGRSVFTEHADSCAFFNRTWDRTIFNDLPLEHSPTVLQI
jgi:hypothetical protein